MCIPCCHDNIICMFVYILQVCGPDVSSSEASRILLQQKPTKSSSVELVCGLPGMLISMIKSTAVVNVSTTICRRWKELLYLEQVKDKLFIICSCTNQ